MAKSARTTVKEKSASMQWAGLGILAVIAIGAYVWWSVAPGSGGVQVAVKVPQLSAVGMAGQQVFEKNCASCHGDNGSGTSKGPPLIHPIYEPNHHADGAILRAITEGVRAHHWPYGDMPAQRQVGREESQVVVGFLREVQRANGIR